MAIKYLDAKRIRGTATERTALSGTTAPPQTSWKLLDRVTLGSAGDTLDTGTFAAKDNLMLLIIGYKSGNGQIEDLTFNADTGNNYAVRYSETGETDQTYVNSDSIELGIDSEDDEFAVVHIRNIANKEKLVIGHTIARGSTGTGAIGNRLEVVGKWANTSNQITRVTLTNPHSGDLDTGSELVVLGCDDDEADSGTNFWQELASADLSGGAADVVSTGTFTAKKYLLVQGFAEQTGGSITGNVTFNNDGSGNYCRRRQSNGASDSTATGESSIDVMGGETKNRYHSFFAVNVSAKEKLVIGDIVAMTTGAGTAPDRVEFVAKWVNTSAQITRVDLINIDPGGGGSNRYGTKTFIRVWGSD